MKFVLGRLKVGEVVGAEVVEVVSPGQLIVSFAGDLIRVANQSFIDLKPGQRVTLRVQTLRPLSFQLMRRRPGLDVSV